MATQELRSSFIENLARELFVIYVTSKQGKIDAGSSQSAAKNAVEGAIALADALELSDE